MGRKKLTLVKPVCTRDGCPLQGEVHPKCKAHTRANKPCGQPSLDGQFVCRMHGGKTPEALERGTLRQAITAAQRLVAFDPNDAETPEEGLLREVLQSSQTAQALGVAVAGLEDGLGINNLLSTGQSGDIKLHALIGAWTKERELHARLCKMAIDAGIQQRQIDLAEQQAGLMVRVIVEVLQSAALGLTAEQVIEGKVVAAQALRAQSLTAGQPA